MCCIRLFYRENKESVTCSKEQDTEKETLRTHIQHTDTIKQLAGLYILVNQKNVDTQYWRIQSCNFYKSFACVINMKKKITKREIFICNTLIFGR